MHYVGGRMEFNNNTLSPPESPVQHYIASPLSRWRLFSQVYHMVQRAVERKLAHQHAFSFRELDHHKQLILLSPRRGPEAKDLRERALSQTSTKLARQLLYLLKLSIEREEHCMCEKKLSKHPTFVTKDYLWIFYFYFPEKVAFISMQLKQNSFLPLCLVQCFFAKNQCVSMDCQVAQRQLEHKRLC